MIETVTDITEKDRISRERMECCVVHRRPVCSCTEKEILKINLEKQLYQIFHSYV